MRYILKISIVFSVLFLLLNCKHRSEEITTEDTEMPSDSVIIDIPEVAEKMEEYDKTLSYKDYTFEITTKDQELTLKPKGLAIDTSKIIMPFTGKVVNSEIDDLNNDGSPEILIYVKTEYSNDKGTIIGYSVNDGKSIGVISFTNVAEEPKNSNGYQGHDEFSVVETTLVQRFPIYQTDGKTKTGKTRQIQYKLKEGETSRKFVVDKVIEF